MKILITGVAGFIGYHLAKTLLANKNNEIFGIDNLNHYYDHNLKLDRLKDLSISNFDKINISNNLELSNYLNNKKFDVVIHLAAQAGVRYSLENPTSYIQSNIIGTFNLLECLKIDKPKHFIFSSTSSIYGIRKESKFQEFDKSDAQISLYSSTKKSCESMLHSYSYNFGIPMTLLRFFTVYGPWGRPDMALFKFVDAMLKNKPIEVYNKGEMWRDFTYIDDLIRSIEKLINIIPNNKKMFKNDSLSADAPYRIVNVGNQNPIYLKDFINAIEKTLGLKSQKVNLPMQKGDVTYTHSDTSLLQNLINFKPDTKIEYGVKKFCEWYKQYYFNK